MRKLIAACFVLVAFASCQKEIDWSVSNSTQFPGGQTNGDLLVGGLQLSSNNRDTNRLTLSWDANKRLIRYQSAGRVNGVTLYLDTRIIRDTSGRIALMVSKSDTAAVFTDSTEHRIGYVAGTRRMEYSVSTQRGGFFDGSNDSTRYTYNAAGQVTATLTFNDFFGGYSISGRQDIGYDANGNIISVEDFVAMPFSTVYQKMATTTFTYDNQKAAATLGEEGWFLNSYSLLSKNNVIRTVSNAVASGTTYTTVASNLQFNSFGRPTRATITTTPANPPSVMNVTYFYQ